MKEPKTLDEALQSLFTTIRDEKERAAALEVGREEEAYGHRPVAAREGTARVIDFAQWKKKRTARL